MITDFGKEDREEIPPKLEEIVARFESLSLKPVSRPPLVISEQHLNTERDLKDQEKKSNMAYRVGWGGGVGWRRGKPVANVEVMEVMQQMQAKLEIMEMGNQRDADAGDVSEPEVESIEEGEPAEVTPEIRFFKSVLGSTFKPRLEVSFFTRGLNLEELIDWINGMDKFFDYEEMEEGKRLKFFVTKLKGHAALWWDGV